MRSRLARNGGLALASGLLFIFPACEKERNERTANTPAEKPVRTVSDNMPPPLDHNLPPGDLKTCGGENAVVCIDKEFCQFPLGVCAEGTAMGHCISKPDNCAEINEPVCGCNDQTYANECKAWMAGVNVRAKGECKQKENKPRPDEKPENP